MFDSKQTLTTRLADATDLLIDFATLGEYGLEPVGSTRRGCEAPTRTLPIAERTSFNEVLFPNRCSGTERARIATPSKTAAYKRMNRGPGRNGSRAAAPG